MPCSDWSVLLAAEFTGFEEVSGTISLPRESDRIWRGSYKGKDWRYLVSSSCCADTILRRLCPVPLLVMRHLREQSC